ncbi:hypothetical protein [Bradyrhizobium guangzhouense]|uniref:hypothetical protein n=1 Tax=Bradyrhizobium guangzhouense TaxID=1325095 RepID=UPI0013E8DA8D|nr:hypothetical protein [Bradyrhizobium guangzhouense]
MTAGLVFDLGQAGPARLGHSDLKQFNIHSGHIPGEVSGKTFTKTFTVAYARCDF